MFTFRQLKDIMKYKPHSYPMGFTMMPAVFWVKSKYGIVAGLKEDEGNRWDDYVVDSISIKLHENDVVVIVSIVDVPISGKGFVYAEELVSALGVTTEANNLNVYRPARRYDKKDSGKCGHSFNALLTPTEARYSGLYIMERITSEKIDKFYVLKDNNGFIRKYILLEKDSETFDKEKVRA